MGFNLGGIFSFFKRKNQEVNHNWEELHSDDVLNCCEQIGVFEELEIEDEDTINNVCSSVAEIFNSAEKSNEALKRAFSQGFNNHGLNVNDKQANLFVSTYIDCYM